MANATNIELSLYRSGLLRAGFWDGDWPLPYADLLGKAAQAAGTCDLYVGDDGMIYCY